jgi:hypothetical protein
MQFYVVSLSVLRAYTNESKNIYSDSTYSKENTLQFIFHLDIKVFFLSNWFIYEPVSIKLLILNFENIHLTPNGSWSFYTFGPYGPQNIVSEQVVNCSVHPLAIESRSLVLLIAKPSIGSIP